MKKNWKKIMEKEHKKSNWNIYGFIRGMREVVNTIIVLLLIISYFASRTQHASRTDFQKCWIFNFKTKTWNNLHKHYNKMRTIKFDDEQRWRKADNASEFQHMLVCYTSLISTQCEINSTELKCGIRERIVIRKHTNSVNWI